MTSYRITQEVLQADLRVLSSVGLTALLSDIKDRILVRFSHQNSDECGRRVWRRIRMREVANQIRSAAIAADQ